MLPQVKPIGWQAKIANAETTGVVTNPNGLEGNWVELTGHYINASLIKKTITAELYIDLRYSRNKNFTWGAKRITMLLATKTSPGNAESFISLKLRPGNNGSNGNAILETKFTSPPGYLTGTKWYLANRFSNNKKVNRITVTIKKIEEKLLVCIDKTKIAEYEKAIPDTHF